MHSIVHIFCRRKVIKCFLKKKFRKYHYIRSMPRASIEILLYLKHNFAPVSHYSEKLCLKTIVFTSYHNIAIFVNSFHSICDAIATPTNKNNKFKRKNVNHTSSYTVISCDNRSNMIPSNHCTRILKTFVYLAEKTIYFLYDHEEWSSLAAIWNIGKNKKSSKSFTKVLSVLPSCGNS